MWTGESKYTKPASKAGQLFLNAGTERVPIQTAEIDAMGEFESRKIWKDTAEAIRKGDFEFASKAKTLIEVSSLSSLGNPRMRKLLNLPLRRDDRLRSGRRGKMSRPREPLSN